ncbi:MAG: nucleotidyl transferase AbiEii/AbiGii toxin family protein [Syntrophaceae bacterium]|nr:nucleotidyl transferase AbiEii/AbiGii toxin family protein [Syntrophaceae bacterium]
MRNLTRHEKFEIEMLDRLNSGKFLRQLVFVGGTMLRLCYGLNRFSVDLDFWIVEELDERKLFGDMKRYLAGLYTLKDAANKFHTLLFEAKSDEYPNSLKIEIRKNIEKIHTEQAIAYSTYSDTQVFVTVPALEDVLERKIKAFLDRKEVRDVFDMEFLLKRGIRLNVPRADLERLLNDIEALSRRDYTQKLGSLLEEEDRKYYTKENFKILKLAITSLL